MTFLAAAQVQQVAENAQAESKYVRLSKLEEGKACRFRFFGSAVTGYEIWTTVTDDNGKTSDKCMRFELKPEEVPANARPNLQGKTEFTFFLAGIVWDYQDESFKILSITQKTILDKLSALVADADYGDPGTYDIKITRTKKGDKTEYTVNPSPPKAVIKSIGAAYDELECDLDRWMVGEDAFAAPKAAA